MVTVKRLKANFLSVSTSSEQSETDVLDILNILGNIYTWLTHSAKLQNYPCLLTENQFIQEQYSQHERSPESQFTSRN